MNQNNNNRQQQPKHKVNYALYLFLALIIVGIFIFSVNMLRSSTKSLTIAEFDSYFDNGNITTMVAKPAGGENTGIYTVTGEFKNAEGKTESYSIIMLEDSLSGYVTEIQNGTVKVNYTLTTISSSVIWTLLLELIPFVIIMVIFILMIKGNMGSNNQAFEFGKNRAKLSREKTKTFNDVAGCDEEKQELVEVVDFLKNPKKYQRLGARVPKGVLLVGPPGTGKTLLAKAVAGEASVPFFSISGSDFVEMFVGVGASRVRDLFKTAKENAPCIIFIDEIDAVGRQRGAGMGGGHDEREQTLNQLLVEMDGFGENSGIIIMAATNRPDVLDPALLRPGRFDRQITISSPDIKGREAILKVHARNKRLDSSIDLYSVAQRTPGFSGAEIENLLNEAALLVARDNRDCINIHDIDEAIDRVMMGPAKRSKKYTDQEKKMVAYHEAGHAVIGLILENASEVQKVTIIPRGQAGGYNLMIPKNEKYTQSKSELLESITGYLGGRVAEELTFNEISTGAYQDLKQSTAIARAMVAEYGMSDLGPVQYEESASGPFLGRDYLKEKNFSDAVANEIDIEVRKIMSQCYEQCKAVLTEHSDLLANIANYLLKVETLNKTDIEEIKTTGHLKWFDDEEALRNAAQTEEVKPETEAETKTEE